MPRPLRPGDQPTAAEVNDQWRRTAAAALPPSPSGFVGVDPGIGGSALTDLRPGRPLARLTSRGAGANYGWNQVIDLGDGTYADQPLVPETAWGTPSAGPAWELSGRTDVPADGTVVVELVPGQQDGAAWYFRYDGPGTGAAGGEDDAAGGYGSILGMGPADCVEFSSPGGQGRCSVVLPFAVKGAWTAPQEWTAAGTVATPIGDMTLVFSVAADTPVLTGAFGGGSGPEAVAFKLVSVGSHCAVFVTLDRRVCTAPPGGPCETNALVVSVCCVPCHADVTAYCDIPPWYAHFPQSLVSVTDFPDPDLDGCGTGCTDTGGTTVCCSGEFALSLAWNADHTAVIADLAWGPGGGGGLTGHTYEVVSVISWLPFHATITLTEPGCNGAGAVGDVIEIWQQNGAESTGSPVSICATMGPRPQVECASCPGGVGPQAWVVNACCLNQGAGGTGIVTMAYDADCVWSGVFPAVGYSVEVADGTITLTFPSGAVYAGEVGTNCCEPKVLTRVTAADAFPEALKEGCLPLFPPGTDPKLWPDEVTIYPYGECDGPGPAEPCGVEGCPDGAADSYKVAVLDGSGDFFGANGTWEFAYGGGVWSASQGGWTGTYVPGNPGVLTLTLDSDPTGVYVVFSFTFSVGCCGDSIGYNLVDYSGSGTFPSAGTLSSVGQCGCPE